MIEKQLEIINKLGLHARAASKLVKLASRFESDITIAKGERKASGKSIMGVMMLAASRGSVVALEVSGADEELAAEEIEKLIGDRFGEAE
ncbi:HPr family phosphocarrier protein [Pseudomonadota bacterium]